MEARPGDKPRGQSGGMRAFVDQFNGTGGKQAPADPPTPKPAPVTIRADTSAFELLSRKIGEDDARRLRRFLTECSHGDENSYPFNHALVTFAQWQMAASVPVETAKVLEQHANTAQDAARIIAQAADAKLADFTRARTELGEILVELKAHTAQLHTVAQEGKAQLQGLTNDFQAVIGTARTHQEQEFAARRQRTWGWAVGTGVALVALGWFAFYQTERQAGERWKAEQTAQLNQWHEQQAADWRKWAENQAQGRLQALEPATYRLAQQIERSKRQVKLPEGGTGWEITLFDDAGILSVDTSFDAQPIRQRYQVHLRDDPERVALSAAAPAANGGAKERARP